MVWPQRDYDIDNYNNKHHNQKPETKKEKMLTI